MIKISQRLNVIFSHIPNCNKFADIGCDHGYISYKMLSQNKCKSLIFSDISYPSLQKAEKLLKCFSNCKGVCCAGLEKIDTDTDTVLIAGMGGENIITILEQGFLPKQLILQPMKNTDKLRVFLNKNGYFLQKDFIFKAEDKFYNLIVANFGKETLTKEQIEYGKTNLLSPTGDFLEYLQKEIGTKQKILQELSGDKKEQYQQNLQKEIALYENLRVKG